MRNTHTHTHHVASCVDMENQEKAKVKVRCVVSSARALATHHCRHPNNIPPISFRFVTFAHKQLIIFLQIILFCYIYIYIFCSHVHRFRSLSICNKMREKLLLLLCS